jgi:AcrR family transcriptional regulator
MPSETRKRLIDAATARFYRDGFRNVGIDQLLADVGISKTAFYKHFQSKDDLMLAVLDQHDRWIQDTLRNIAKRVGGETPLGQLHALFDVVGEILDTEGFQGCIFVNASMEFPLHHDPTHVAAARSKRAVEDIVCEMAESAGIAQPRRLAKELCLVMEGAYVTRHVTGDRETIDVARRIADAVIERHCRDAATAST